MTRLYVDGISTKVDIEEVRDHFADHGKLKFFGIKDGAGYIVCLSI